MTNFAFSYSKILADAVGADFDDNHDADRFGPHPTTRPDWKTRAGGILSAVGLATARARSAALSEARHMCATGLDFIAPHLTDLEWLHAKLNDDESREILVKVVAFRALGNRRIRLPLNNPSHWELLRRAKDLPRSDESLETGFLGWKLHCLDLGPFGYPIRMFLTPAGALTQFVEQQYRCETPQGVIECSSGDTAVDAGACWGDTALLFAHKAGVRGKVFSFEFLPENLAVLRRNLTLNPELSPRISVKEHPVWSKSGEALCIRGSGPGTQVHAARGDESDRYATTISIDDLVRSGETERVDFIKMDIEGAELEALKGSEMVLREFKPKLAITVYHDLKDFWTIPRYLESLDLGYRFYLRHFKIHAEETVLFATVR